MRLTHRLDAAASGEILTLTKKCDALMGLLGKAE